MYIILILYAYLLKIYNMCGIVCAFDIKQPSESLRPEILEMSKRLDTEVLIGSGVYSSDMLLCLMKD